jgi:hypothetical protein
MYGSCLSDLGVFVQSSVLIPQILLVSIILQTTIQRDVETQASTNESLLSLVSEAANAPFSFDDVATPARPLENQYVPV